LRLVLPRRTLVRAIKTRQLKKMLAALGCHYVRPGKGDHEVWACPCGHHQAILVTKAETAAGTYRSITQQLACLRDEEWWT